jgi:arginine utilization protein RocB
MRPFFPGISDMSFLYPDDDEGTRLLAAAACPLGLDPLPSGFACPVVNIGPWGREYHQRLERMHASYAFETLPDLLERVVTEIFKSAKQHWSRAIRKDCRRLGVGGLS